MNRILVHIPMMPYGEYDIFSQPDNGEFLKVVQEKHQGVCPNVGNRLWFQGLISEIESPNNHLEYFSPSMSKDYINESYDFIIAPMANVFAKGFRELLESLAERFRGIKIPVYVIACGVQADHYDQLGEICSELKEPASKFIASVYNTGGEFALRGHFTKEFFDRLGFSSAVVTGCPSIYQRGRNLRITEEKVSSEQFRPLLNGNPVHYPELFRTYPNAEFFDQSTYFHELLDPNFFGGAVQGGERLRRMVKKYGLETTTYLLQDRIKLIPDMNTWREYLIHGKFSLSYGSRIHGSIMPILAGIPAVLECRDARTREMAEFFDIPCVAPEEHKKYSSLYELYQETSYASFNANFAARFDAYEAFLRRFGIVEHINEENKFFHPLDEIGKISCNQEQRAELLVALKRNNVYWKVYERLIAAKRKIKSRM